MRIGVDIRPLQDKSRFRGIGYYLSHILTELSNIDRKNEYFLYLYSGASIDLKLNPKFRYKFIEITPFTTYELRYKLRSSLKQSLNVSKDNLDLFFVSDPSYGIPRGAKKTIGVLYDLIPIIFSDRYPEGKFILSSKQDFKRWIVRVLSRFIYTRAYKSLLKTRAIFSISESTKKDFLQRFNYPKYSVFVTHLAPDSVYKPVDPLTVKNVLIKYGLEEPFLVYVGGCDFRKNLEKLVLSFERLKGMNSNLKLVLVGNDFIRGTDPDSQKIQKQVELSKYKNEIIRPGYVSNEDLASLYSSASVFIYPSIYEGFGLPILEAMACGCPVISYNNSSIPEVAGDAALLLEPDDDLAEAIKKVITDEKLRKSMIKKGFQQARKFSWEKTARQTLKVLEEVGLSK